MTDFIPGQGLLTDKDVILVTGGTGCLGQGIKRAVDESKKAGKPILGTFYYAGSKDGDLRDYDQAKAVFEKVKPTYVIHGAARVGGLQQNMKFKVNFWMDNVQMNNNVLRLANEYNVKKVVSCLSTVVFPTDAEYPVSEDAAIEYKGPPHKTNDSYGYAKRMLDMLGRWYNEQNKDNGTFYTSIIVSNMFGPFDDFTLERGHVVPAFIHRCHKAKLNNLNMTVMGTGKPLRQFLFNYDAGRLFLWVLFNYNVQEPIIASPTEEKSIAEACLAVCKAFDFNGQVIYETDKPDGVFRRTAKNDKFLSLYPEFQFTPFQQAIDETVKWYVDNYDIARK